ncbi:MAG TPA: HlyD family efflux transporter periplasmic adaptor subunit [Chloroflexota bacterium]
MTETPRTAQAPAAPGVGGNGVAGPMAPGAPARPYAPSGVAEGAAGPDAPEPRRGGRRRLVLGVLLVGVLAVGGVVGYRYWYDSTYFVNTDNAQIAGRLVQVGALAAGRVATVRYDVGQRVGKDEVVATLYAPVPVGTTTGGTPRLEFRETQDALVEVRSPVEGVVVARGGNPGDTVPAGQPLVTLVDPRQLWISANVEETQVRRLQRGQPVSVHVDVWDVDLAGRVAAITPASAATFSLLPSQNVSGNFTKSTQLVPVKIDLEQPDPRLLMGTSVEVRIRVRE